MIVTNHDHRKTLVVAIVMIKLRKSSKIIPACHKKRRETPVSVLLTSCGNVRDWTKKRSRKLVAQVIRSNIYPLERGNSKGGLSQGRSINTWTMISFRGI
jgi:hypothetical protein